MGNRRTHVIMTQMKYVRDVFLYQFDKGKLNKRNGTKTQSKHKAANEKATQTNQMKLKQNIQLENMPKAQNQLHRISKLADVACVRHSSEQQLYKDMDAYAERLLRPLFVVFPVAFLLLFQLSLLHSVFGRSFCSSSLNWPNDYTFPEMHIACTTRQSSRHMPSVLFKSSRFRSNIDVYAVINQR